MTDELLLVFVGLSSLLSLLRFRVAPKLFLGWILVSIGLFALSLALWLLQLEGAGFWALAAWGVLVLAPSLLQKEVARRITRDDHVNAKRFARVLAVLHPADGFREQPQFLSALGDIAAGRHAEAESALHRLSEDAHESTRRLALLQLLRLREDWEGMLRLTGDRAETIQRDPRLGLLQIRALGETGRFEEMFASYDALQPILERLSVHSVQTARLFVLAFSGRSEAVETLFQGGLAGYSARTASYWRALAARAAGEEERARAIAAACPSPSDPQLRSCLERTMPAPLAPSAQLDQRLDAIESEALTQERYSSRAARGAPRPLLTWLVIFINAGIFLAEMLGGEGQGLFSGSTDLENLYELGALYPNAVADGEAWRLLSAAFLHYGPAHLLLNMLALLIFGPFVERSLGAARYILLYLLSTVLALSAVLYITGIEGILVGASGGVFAIVGATIAILLRAWLFEKARPAARRLRGLVALVLIQVTHDLFMPQVSAAAHLFGLVAGLFLTLLILPRRQR